MLTIFTPDDRSRHHACVVTVIQNSGMDNHGKLKIGVHVINW